MSQKVSTVVNPVEIYMYLQGAHYPISKADLIEVAADNGADREVLDTLHDLPSSDYFSLSDVMHEISVLELQDEEGSWW